MTTAPVLTTELYPHSDARRRTFALFYFAFLMTVWHVVGHTVLGFEQSWMQPILAVLTACAVQVFLDFIDAASNQRKPRLLAGWLPAATTLLPAWISGGAVGMLLWPNRLLLPIVFASALSIASKVMFRAPYGGGTQHIYNPSNFGITVTLIICPWVSIAPPYHFTENVVGIWNWIIPGIILLTGLIVHSVCTGRLPLVAAWLIGFVAQAAFRHFVFGSSLIAALLPMTGAAFVLFTLYMIPDPATTPIKPRNQVLFGLSTALVYATIQVNHLVYGLFGALFLVSTLRAVGLYVLDWQQRRKTALMSQA